MVIEYIRYTVETERQTGFLEAYAAAGESLQASPHCLGYELTRCSEAPESFILRILWSSTEAHLKGFRASAEFKAFFPHIQPFLKDIAEMRHYEPTAVTWSR